MKSKGKSGRIAVFVYIFEVCAVVLTLSMEWDAYATG